jgi:hypothetical protein
MILVLQFLNYKFMKSIEDVAYLLTYNSSCQGGLGRHAIIVHLQLIDYRFDGWIYCSKSVLNKLLLTYEVL